MGPEPPCHAICSPTVVVSFVFRRPARRRALRRNQTVVAMGRKKQRMKKTIRAATTAKTSSSTTSNARPILLLSAGLVGSQSGSRLGHTKRAARLIVADSGTDQHDQAAGLHLSLLDSVVKCHANAGGAGVAILLHDGMRAFGGHA